MRTFYDHKIDNNAKIGIDGLVSTLTTRKASHKGAWPRIIRSMLINSGYSNVHILSKNSKWDDYDAIIMDLGMEFKGTFNLFGGANDELHARLIQFAYYKGKLFSYDKDFPSIVDLIETRYHTGSEKFKSLAGIKELFREKKVHTIDHIYCSDYVVLGDSHCISQYEPGYMLYRHDGQTLHGFLSRPPQEFFDIKDGIKKIKLYFGNIDIRHHLMRQDDPVESMEKLVSHYFTRIACLMSLHGIKSVDIISALPIESESRKLPKTGYYKNTPFYGERQERAILSSCFNELLFDYAKNTEGVSVVLHPTHFLLEDSSGNPTDELDMEVMEKPKSVHISPEHYYWDLDSNEVNKYQGLVTGQLSLG